MRTWIICAALLIGVIGLFYFTRSGGSSSSKPPSVTLPAWDNQTKATFVGGAACATCHAAQTALWHQSHHDRAMELPSKASMLGNFADATIKAQGVETSFHKNDQGWSVRAIGADGHVGEHKVAYTFGVYPLQQYLLDYKDGRKQALPIAWDARPKEQGGQRWFDLLADRETPVGHALHWTGGFYTWNRTCAECHSTNLDRGYDRTTNTYRTTFSDLDVSCEACHGAGSRHVAWATNGMPAATTDKGLAVILRGARLDDWVIDSKTGIAKSATKPRHEKEMDSCAPCHARRSSLGVKYEPGMSFMQHYSPSLLENGLYHADGQIDDEVFEYGSFVQSRMHQAGVTCSDCHEPHSAKLRANGNDLCARCHQTTRFDTPEHHHHQMGSKGASCVECHMPHNNYMTVHDRRDHSIKIPRPDLAKAIGAPDACSKCHQKTDKAKDNVWAANAWKNWWGEPKPIPEVEAMAAGRARSVGALAKLKAVLADAKSSPMVRGSVASLISRQSGATTADVQIAVTDPNPLVRLGAAEHLGDLPGDQQLKLAPALLRDDVRSVRIAAIRQLGANARNLPESEQVQWKKVWAEAVAAAVSNGDQAEALLDLGNLRLAAGDPNGADSAFNEALTREPTYQPARMNLADLARQRGDEVSAQTLLRTVVKQDPNNAAAHHALGLSLVRAKQYQLALVEFAEAVRLDPADARYALVLAMATHDLGDPPASIKQLQEALKRHPTDLDLLSSCVNFLREAGRGAEALPLARQLGELLPADVSIQAMIKELEAGKR